MRPDSMALPTLRIDLAAVARGCEGLLAGRTDAQLEAARNAYLGFFRLAALHPEKALAPTALIDEMWHLHMLHPVAYHADCMEHLGYLMDHDAGFGFTPEERPQLLSWFQDTSELWAAAFGTSYAQGTPDQDATICGKKEDSSPTICGKKEEETEPTVCGKKKEELEPTICGKKKEETEPTICGKAPQDGSATTGEDGFSADLIKACERSKGPLAKLDTATLKRVLADYAVFLKEAAKLPGQLPSDPFVGEMWRMHILHPVAYRRDCLSILGSVLDHVVEARRPAAV